MKKKVIISICFVVILIGYFLNHGMTIIYFLQPEFGKALRRLPFYLYFFFGMVSMITGFIILCKQLKDSPKKLRIICLCISSFYVGLSIIYMIIIQAIIGYVVFEGLYMLYAIDTLFDVYFFTVMFQTAFPKSERKIKK